MEISLNQENKKFVKSQIQYGRFKDTNEAVNEGLRLLEEREKWLDQEIQRGLDSGPSEPWNLDDFLEKAHKRADKLGLDY